MQGRPTVPRKGGWKCGREEEERSCGKGGGGVITDTRPHARPPRKARTMEPPPRPLRLHAQLEAGSEHEQREVSVGQAILKEELLVHVLDLPGEERS